MPVGTFGSTFERSFVIIAMPLTIRPVCQLSVLPGAALRRNHPFCDGHHILGGTIPITSSVFATASAVRPNGRELLMRKFGFIAAGAFIVACFGGWIASTNARVAPPASSVSIAPMQMMAVSANLPAEHFVDYSVIFPN
jgi:hypothetical protein